MTRVGAGLLGCCGLLLLASGAIADAEPDPLLAEMGEPYFARYCSACHGPQGRGDGPVAETLRTRPPDLTQIASRRGGRFPDSEIAQRVDGRFAVPAHGSREMPVWGERFSEAVPEPDIGDEIARGKVILLVEYLKSIQRSSPSE